jgi:lipase maturation factor 1
LSLCFQIRGLVGTRGVLPAGEYFQRAHEVLGGAAYGQLPSLLWLSASDAMLHVLCIAGLIASALLVVGRAEGLSLVAAWACYLSLAVAGQTFLNFQWDALLLESLFTALFWARWEPQSRAHLPESPAGRWLLWLLAFKLMFLSGATKLLSGDPTWRDLSALTYHYQTQPLPSWISWWAHRLPPWAQQASVVGMLSIELALPLVLLVPWRQRLARRLMAAGFVILQSVIAWTGNYGFFNVLSIALAVTLLDDDVWRRWWPARSGSEVALVASRPVPRFVVGLAATFAVLSLLAMVEEMQSTARKSLPGWERTVVAALQPTRSINGYGLFRVMTTERPEIVVELMDQRGAWRELRFRYKPGELARRPGILPLHMPRLDWQMWFAALDPGRAEAWLVPFLERLLHGEPAVWRLLGEPQPQPPPRAARLVLYRYRFTTAEERAKSGRWWEREEMQSLTRDLVLDSAGRLTASP